MKSIIPMLYQHEIPNLERQLKTIFEQGIAKWHDSGKNINKIQLFFRADDIAVPSGNFKKLIALFQKHQLPLCLAVVPTWLTVSRAKELLITTGQDSYQWCWHQHGRMHKNFEPHGKKQEFGPARSYDEILRHLSLGKDRLQEIFNEKFSPYFTPPWNRCSSDTALALKSLGFLGISRFAGARPDLAGILPEIPVNVDLHTRKEKSTEIAASAMFAQLLTALGNGYCGIMIHHQLMNDLAIRLLDLLLAEVVRRDEIKVCLFQDLVDGK